MYINARPPWCMHALGGTSGAIEATGTTLHTATACSPPLFQATIKAIYRSTNTLNMHCRGNSLTHTYMYMASVKVKSCLMTLSFLYGNGATAQVGPNLTRNNIDAQMTSVTA